MSHTITLRAGIPDEANRDYLPEIIKTTQIVVNENGNNSQPYPENLVEKTCVLLPDGLADTWYEYVPATYDPSKKTPLVISCHGGLMTGWGQCIYTSWSYVADREGFIVVFPSANRNRFWQLTRANITPSAKEPPRKIGSFEMPPFAASNEENHDIQFIMALIADVEKRYHIDEGRVYIQGMSMGGIMSNQMIGYAPLTFAAYATSGAPGTPANIMGWGKEAQMQLPPVSHFLSMPEHNGWDKDPARCRDQKQTVREAVAFWKTMNGCDALPKIRIDGEDNFAFYTGTKANLVVRDIRNRDHGQTLDDADLVWRYLFSGTRREADHSITTTATESPCEGDAFGVMLFDGLDKAWVNGKPAALKAPVTLYQKLKYHGLDGGQAVRGEYFTAPVSFLAEVVGAEYRVSDDGKCASLTLRDGRRVDYALGSIGCVVDNQIYSMDCEARMIENELCIPVEWFFNRLMNLRVSRRENALYITDHYAELSTYVAMLVEDILTSEG